MEKILVKPEKLEQTATELRQRAEAIKRAVENTDQELAGLGPEVFTGVRADRLRSRYRRQKEGMFNFAYILKNFAQNLENAAASFRSADSPGPVPRKSPEQPTPVQEKPQNSPVNPSQSVETVDYNKSAPTDDCVKFVKGQRSNVPVGFSPEKFYSGNYKGSSGVLDNGTQYGQEPKVGSIMVESPNSKAGISYGHASYVIETQKDSTGKVTSYKIAEGSWGSKTQIHYEEFVWNASSNIYVSKTGKRNPDMFIY